MNILSVVDLFGWNSIWHDVFVNCSCVDTWWH